MHIINPYRYAGATTLVYDTFTDTAFTSLTAHTPDIDTVGGGWLAGANSLRVSSINPNKAESPGAVQAQNWIDAGASDVVVTATCVNNTGGLNMGMMVRVTDYNDHWLFQWTSNTFYLYEKTGGGYTLRDSVAKTISGGTPFVIEATLSGTSISGTIDGGSTLSYTSSTHQSNTKHGFDNYGASNWDDFTVVG